MEYQGDVAKQRFYAKPHDFAQMTELAYYIAKKRKQPIRIDIGGTSGPSLGLYTIISDLTKYIKGVSLQVNPDGKMYNVVDVNKPVPKPRTKDLATAKRAIKNKELMVDKDTQAAVQSFMEAEEYNIYESVEIE